MSGRFRGHEWSAATRTTDGRTFGLGVVAELEVVAVVVVYCLAEVLVCDGVLDVVEGGEDTRLVLLVQAVRQVPQQTASYTITVTAHVRFRALVVPSRLEEGTLAWDAELPVQLLPERVHGVVGEVGGLGVVDEAAAVVRTEEIVDLRKYYCGAVFMTLFLF